MLFNKFVENVPKILNVTLPALESHAKMAPSNRIELIQKLNLAATNPRKAAVLMLLYPKNNMTHLVLIQRNSYTGVHSAQIGFPGGKPEVYDADLIDTALRETHEEIGVIPNKIMVHKAFTEVFIPPSNYIVHPFFGTSFEELTFFKQDSEVADIIELPLEQFLDDGIITSKVMKTSYAGDFEVPGFMVEKHFVWGATAMMLSELKDALKATFF